MNPPPKTLPRSFSLPTPFQSMYRRPPTHSLPIFYMEDYPLKLHVYCTISIFSSSNLIYTSGRWSKHDRMNQLCLQLHSGQFMEGIASFFVHLQNQKCNMKLYMVPGVHGRRPFAVACSFEPDRIHRGIQVSSNVLGPKGPQKSKKLLDTSTNPVDSMNDLERGLQELFDEVKTLVGIGRKNDAVELLLANYEAVKEQMDAGARGMEEAAILDVIALGYMAIEDLKMVGSLLDMLNEIVKDLKNDEPLLDSVLMHMGSMYSTLGKFDKSLLSYRKALEIIESKYGNNSTVLITPLLNMAKVLGFTGRATKAMDIYHRAISIVELSRGTESKELVIPLFALGNLLIKEGKALDAESPFNRILSIYTNLYGEHDGRVGMAMCSLAHAKCAKGNVNEAIDLYRNALNVIKDSKHMALDDNIMEKMRIDLAELLHVVGRGKEGRALLEECLFITEKYKGNNHPSLVPHLINLATSYSRSKDFVEAERLLRTSLQIMTKTVPPNDQSITFPMLHLAVALYKLNHNEEAEQLAREVLYIREKAFGTESLPVGEALDCLVSIQSRLEKDDREILEMLKRVLKIQEKAFGYDSEEVVETLKKIVFYLDKMGMKDEKFGLQRRLSMLRDEYKNMVGY